MDTSNGPEKNLEDYFEEKGLSKKDIKENSGFISNLLNKLVPPTQEDRIFAYYFGLMKINRKNVKKNFKNANTDSKNAKESVEK